MRRALLFSVVLLGATPGLARAELLSITQRFVADFEFSLEPDSPINPGGPLTPFIPFQAVGDLTFTFAAALNDPSQPTTVAITGFSGVLDGVAPLGPFLPYTISPNVQFVGGSLTDIVRDGNGEVTSANVSGLSAFWELIGPGGLRLYGTSPLVFNGPIGGLPFAVGNMLAGPDPFDVFIDTNGGTDFKVATGQNRTLTAVPEPSSLALLGLGALSLARFARRRKAAAPQS